MARDTKYGIVLDEAGKLRPEEPVFIIRAKDAIAPAAVRTYAEIAEREGASDEHVQAVYAVADRIDAWQAVNPALVKVPD